ncbi:hypothetical protein [Deinococcus sonorensis]|uniref:Uncharacterized protein n=2 Tax=Deinococcus sonorensis TaxID=309891 RepID=A0AAU7U732_9DEIO
MYLAELIVSDDVYPLGLFPTAPQARLHCFRHTRGLLKLHWYEVEHEVWIATLTHDRDFLVRHVAERVSA